MGKLSECPPELVENIMIHLPTVDVVKLAAFSTIFHGSVKNITVVNISRDRDLHKFGGDEQRLNSFAQNILVTLADSMTSVQLENINWTVRDEDLFPSLKELHLVSVAVDLQLLINACPVLEGLYVDFFVSEELSIVSPCLRRVELVYAVVDLVQIEAIVLEKFVFRGIPESQGRLLFKLSPRLVEISARYCTVDEYDLSLDGLSAVQVMQLDHCRAIGWRVKVVAPQLHSFVMLMEDEDVGYFGYGSAPLLLDSQFSGIIFRFSI